MRKAILVALIIVGLSADTHAEESKAESCTPTSRLKTFTIPFHAVKGGQGIQNDVKDIKFTMIESRTGKCQLSTQYVLEFTEYNHWQSTDHGLTSLYIDLKANGQVIKAQAVTSYAQMGYCGPYGTPGRLYHFEGGMSVNYFDVTDDIQMTDTGIHQKVGKC